MQRSEAKIGMKVYFGRPNGEKSLGEIVKINSKNFKVKLLEARGQYRSHRVGGMWTVPPTLCTPAEEGRPAHITKKAERRPCLVNVLTGKKTYGPPGMSEDMLFGLMANGMLD